MVDAEHNIKVRLNVYHIVESTVVNNSIESLLINQLRKEERKAD